MTMTDEQIEELVKVADLNDGHCDRCGRIIKIYRYKINRTLAVLLRDMAKRVETTGVNDVDLTGVVASYSTRSQITKARLHGLVARVKNDQGAQINSRWLITKKGFDFLSHRPIQEVVVAYSNQVLGHEGSFVTIHEVMGERYNPDESLYESAPVSTAEARVYHDVRKPAHQMKLQAAFIGRYPPNSIKANQVISIHVERLALGKPVKVVSPIEAEYPDIASFQRSWRIEK